VNAAGFYWRVSDGGTPIWDILLALAMYFGRCCVDEKAKYTGKGFAICMSRTQTVTPQIISSTTARSSYERQANYRTVYLTFFLIPGKCNRNCPQIMCQDACHNFWIGVFLVMAITNSIFFIVGWQGVRNSGPW
jgi:hypothetical protein